MTTSSTMETQQACALSIVAFLTYYFVFVAKKARIYASNQKQKWFLSKLQILSETYYPTIFYFHGIMQTIFGLTKRIKHRLPYNRRTFTLKDGGQVGLDFLDPEQVGLSTSTDILVVILPGLTSSSQTSYVKTVALACAKAGTKLVVVNNRGLGGVPLKTPRTFCASDCEDLKEVMDYLKEQYPTQRKIAIGTSLGGIILSHYLTKYPDDAKENLQCAVLISIVWNAHTATDAIEQPITKFFVNSALADSLKTLVRKHRDVLSTKYDIDKVLKNSNTLRDFDSNFTAPQFSYKNVKEYYDAVTVSTRVDKFPIPVFGLSAADDPMQPGGTQPTKEAEAHGSNLALIVTARGGHLGFLEGFYPTSKPMHYMERFIYSFLLNFSTYGKDLVASDPVI